MNATYRIVWHAATSQWVVASELAKGRKKKSNPLRLAVLAVALGLGVPMAASATAESCALSNGETGVTDEAGQCVAEQPAKAGIGARALISPDYAAGGGGDSGDASSVVIGRNATGGSAAGTGSAVAIGDSAKTSGGVGAVAIGNNARATGSAATALGTNNTANGTGATAVGRESTASADYSTAVGNLAYATGTSAIAIGDTTFASAGDAIAIGTGVVANAQGSIALGGSSQATANQSVALGFGSIADRANTVSVGSAGNLRQITNVANGTEDSDAVTVAQLKAVGLIDPIGDPLAAVAYDDMTLGKVTLGGLTGTIIDNLQNGLIAAGSMQAVNGGQLYALQQDFQSQFDGLSDRVGAIEAGGGGTPVDPTPGEPAPIDPSMPGTGDGSTAVGAGSTASGNGSTAVGQHASATGENSTALGSSSSATGDNSVALGSGSVADRDNTVSVGSEGHERQITNVAAGTQRTDAANWGQVQDAVNGVKDWASQKFSDMDRRIDRMGAMSAAYGQMAFSAQGLEQRNRLGVGVGTQGGQSAIAVGYARQAKPNINISFGGSASAGDASLGAGFAVGW